MASSPSLSSALSQINHQPPAQSACRAEEEEEDEEEEREGETGRDEGEMLTGDRHREEQDEIRCQGEKMREKDRNKPTSQRTLHSFLCVCVCVFVRV